MKIRLERRVLLNGFEFPEKHHLNLKLNAAHCRCTPALSTLMQPAPKSAKITPLYLLGIRFEIGSGWCIQSKKREWKSV